jgi:hypothetical protein
MPQASLGTPCSNLGMPSLHAETPNEERTMPTVKPRSPRRHSPSLQRFSLEELASFTKEGTFASDASRDFHLFYVGRDDVHGILKYLFSRAATSLYMNMFGYDDEELNAECSRLRPIATSRPRRALRPSTSARPSRIYLRNFGVIGPTIGPPQKGPLVNHRENKGN